MKGWISLHRRLQEHELWKDKPFSRGQAWVDILLMVNHKEEKTLFDGNIITVNKGSRITSVRKLCDRWGWSNTKVIKFLKNLEMDEMLTYFSDKKKTVLTVVNYGLYQNETSEKRHRNDTETTQKHTNNNDNNNNNKHMSEFEAEFEKLWKMYPSKKGKEASKKKYPALRKKYSYEDLEQTVRSYAKECQGKDPQYIKHGSTFFNGGFMDFLEVDKPKIVDGIQEYLNSIRGET